MNLDPTLRSFPIFIRDKSLRSRMTTTTRDRVAGRPAESILNWISCIPVIDVKKEALKRN
jgi:hypothetical protein